MMPSCRGRRPADAALSEVVGFVLILGVLVLVFSLYLTYGIPAQGRENEILHMNEVKDQFVAYKISLDSLFNNNKVGTTLGSSFNLGTGGGYTQGMVSIIPIMNPVSSGGIIAINQRTPVHETLNISSHSLVLNDTYRTVEDLPHQVSYVPTHIYIDISGIQTSDLRETGTLGINVSGKTWIAYINLTPQMTSDIYYSTVAPSPTLSYPTFTIPGSSGGTTYYPSLTSTYERSDITVNLVENGVKKMQNYTVFNRVSPGYNYTVDMMDTPYGLGSLVRPGDTISFTVDKPLTGVQVTGNATYDFVDMNPYIITPIALGSVEYRAQNNYWIPQDYYYQMGGVFLSQAEGNVSYKLPPEISFTNDSARNLISVNINALSFDPNNRGLIGGNSPVQVRTKLESVYPIPYVKGDEITGNTKRVWIGVNTSDPKANAMWESFFDSTARGSGIPPGEYNVSRINNESYIEIFGPSADPDVNDIRLMVTNATYSTWVHGVGGVYE